MPIYEYKCRECGRNFEIRQSVSADPLTVCENCGGQLEKQWSLSGFQFKGDGWYVTDYSKKNGSAPAETKSAAKSETASTESTSTADSASNKSKDTSADTGSVKTKKE